MDNCDLWEGRCNSAGYGSLYIDYVDGRGIQMGAHRLVWLQNNGYTDLHILHSCDTPACINIDHLRAGTPADNMRDRDERGRFNNGQAEKTHCKHGHKYSDENTYIYGNNRQCKICRHRRNKNRNRSRANG